MNALKENLANGKKEFLVVIENDNLGIDPIAGAAARICYDIMDYNKENLLSSNFYITPFPSSLKLIEQNEKEFTFELQFEETFPKGIADCLVPVFDYFKVENKKVENGFALFNLDKERTSQVAENIWRTLLKYDALEALLAYLFYKMYSDKQNKLYAKKKFHACYMARDWMAQLAKFIKKKRTKRALKQWDLCQEVCDQGEEYYYTQIQFFIFNYIDVVYNIKGSISVEDEHCSCGCEGHHHHHE